MSEGSGHQGLWIEAKYPGDRVRSRMLIRDGELGEICIQQYDSKVRVGSFLPGNHFCLPGDTPKTEPERCEWFYNNFAADEQFDKYVQDAYADLWQNWERG
jgi:hypothetical protein